MEHSTLNIMCSTTIIHTSKHTITYSFTLTHTYTHTHTFTNTHTHTHPPHTHEIVFKSSNFQNCSHLKIKKKKKLCLLLVIST